MAVDLQITDLSKKSWIFDITIRNQSRIRQEIYSVTLLKIPIMNDTIPTLTDNNLISWLNDLKHQIPIASEKFPFLINREQEDHIFAVDAKENNNFILVVVLEPVITYKWYKKIIRKVLFKKSIEKLMSRKTFLHMNTLEATN
ncbi:MAG: hypothetical protein HeimC3_53410 [Candidatus Heimdallarchaeota archaeon LC_3]|nr:MAG: hypothetical protein HeimC3_53410 [Candidatus Heimdallarchaeota archaeon LC_3]